MVQRSKNYVVAMAVGVLALVVVAASYGAGSGTSKRAADSPLVKMAKQKVAAFEAGPTKYAGPTQPFNPGKGTAAVMACGFAAPVCADQSKEAVTALKAMGWTVSPAFDGQFSPQVQAGFLDRAVQQKLDAVIMVSVDVTTIKPAVDRAIAAGLNILCTFCVSREYYGKKTTKGWVYDVTADFEKQGEMDAWKVLSQNGENAKVAVFTDKAFDPLPPRLAGFTKVFKTECPKCPFQVRYFATGDIAKPGPPEFNALLATKPAGTLTNVVGHYDGMGMAMAKTLKQIGRTDIKVVAYDTTTDSINALVTGSPAAYTAAAAGPYSYAEWAAADVIGRLKAGKPLWPGRMSLQSTLIDATNAKQHLPPNTVDPTPSGDWRGVFKKLWGKG